MQQPQWSITKGQKDLKFPGVFQSLPRILFKKILLFENLVPDH